MFFLKKNIKFLACPVCKRDLRLDIKRESEYEIISGWLGCPNCNIKYKIENGIPSLIPTEYCKNDKYGEWLEKQRAGIDDYINPDLNYKEFIKVTSRMFGVFCQHKGNILDIGCGIDADLEYFDIKNYPDINFIGLDPIIGDKDHNFNFIQGVGEYLPVKDESIDQVIMSTMLDHVIDPLPVLKEAKRVLKKEGIINIWIGIFDIDFRDIDSLSLKVIFNEIFHSFIRRKKKSKKNLAKSGKSDLYHFNRFERQQIFSLVENTGMAIDRFLFLDEGSKYLFLKFKK